MKEVITVVLAMEVQNGRYDELKTFLIQNLPNVRNFDGCSSVDVLFNSETQKMIFSEVWESENHHQKYIEFISKNGVMPQLISFLKEAPSVTYYTKLEL